MFMEQILENFLSIEFDHKLMLDWLIAAAISVTLFLVLQLIFRVLNRRMASISQKTATIMDDLVAASLAATHSYVLFVVAVWVGLQIVDAGKANEYLDFALIVACTVQVALWANKMVSAYIVFYTKAKRADNPGAVSAVQGMSYIVRITIWSIAILLVVDNLGYDVTALVAGLGIGGVAVALALQNILGDLFASLSIVLDKPFVIGDFIIVGDLLGVVERIGLKTTRVRSLSGEQLVFSNSDLLSSRVRNFKRMQERRVLFSFGVTRQTTVDQLELIPAQVKSTIESIDNARFDRAHFKGFGDSSYDFEVVYYVLSADYNQYMDIQQTINLGLCRWFEEVGLDFAYPTRTLYVHQ
jgi:small-conductance mechanosensitive channel